MKNNVMKNGTIDSQALLKMVNEARRLCGEKEVRNNDFIARIKDELEGEGYEIFVTPMDKKKGGADQVVIVMTYKQALRVAAVSRKPSVVRWSTNLNQCNSSCNKKRPRRNHRMALKNSVRHAH